MNFHVLTLFPEMIENGMNTSITGRAITKGLLTLEAVNIRDYAFNKHQKVDDYTYGGCSCTIGVDVCCCGDVSCFFSSCCFKKL